MLLGEIRQDTDSAGRCSLHWLSVPWAGLGKKGCSCPAHSLQIGWISGGALQQARAPFAHSPASRGVEGHRIPSASRGSTLSSLPHSLPSLCPPVPAGGWSTARPAGRCSWGRPPL